MMALFHLLRSWTAISQSCYCILYSHQQHTGFQLFHISPILVTVCLCFSHPNVFEAASYRVACYPFVCLFLLWGFLFVLVRESYYTAQAVVSSQSFCLSLSTGITGIHHHAWKSSI